MTLPALHWQQHWRRYVGALAVVVAVAVVVALVTRGGGGSSLLIQDEPTPTPTTTTATTSPTATTEPSAAATTPAATSDPTTPAAPPATSAGPAPEPVLDKAHLLTTSYVEDAFAQGRTAARGSWSEGNNALLACHAINAPPYWDVKAAGVWSWPDEVVVEESLVSLPSDTAAGQKLAQCHEEATSSHDSQHVSDDTVAVGAGGYVVLRSGGLFGEALAGARVKDSLVLVTWRQSGAISSTAPLEQALRAAVARVLGETTAAPIAAPAPNRFAALVGYLRHDALPTSVEAGGIGVAWDGDWRGTVSIRCQGYDLATTQPPVTRRWTGGAINGGDYLGVYETVAHANDEATAVSDFAACRDSYSGGTAVTGLGDEAFVVDLSGTEEHQVVFVRVGDGYLQVIGHMTDPVPVARAAVDALRAAGRFS